MACSGTALPFLPLHSSVTVENLNRVHMTLLTLKDLWNKVLTFKIKFVSLRSINIGCVRLTLVFRGPQLCHTSDSSCAALSLSVTPLSSFISMILLTILS
jgi:hypothetical protein